MARAESIGFLPANYMPSALLQSWNNAVGKAVFFALLLPIFYYSSSLFWRIVYPEGDSPAVVNVTSAERAESRAAKRSWKWFHDATPAPVQKKVEPSKLDATLLGVIARGADGADGDDQGIAMIQVKREPSRLFRTGDEIVNAVYLEAVAADHVTLRRDDQFEILSLARMGSGKDRERAPAKPERSAAKPPAAKKPEPIVAGSAEEYKKLIREKPIRLMQMVQFDKYEDEENGFGFALSPRTEQDQALFDGLGLEKGDVLLAANDENAKKLSVSPKSWKALLRAKQIRLKVLRGGVVQEITID